MVDNFNDISADEVVLFETRPNKLSEDYDNFISVLPIGFIFSFFLFIFSITLFGLNIIFSIFLSIILGFSFAICILKSLKSNYKDSVKITNKGIILYKDGTDESVKIPFTKIRNFYCKQGIMDKRVHCADIKIHTTTNQYFLTNINEYREVSRIIRENASNLEPVITVGEEIRKKVTSDEKVLWEGKQNLTLLYVFSAIFAIFCFVGSLYTLLVIPKEYIADVMQFIFIGFLFAVFFTTVIYFGIKNDKQTYYIVTNKKLIYCDSYTDGTCKEIPLETIEQCFYFPGTKGNPACIQIDTHEKIYELYSIDKKRKIVSLINNAIKARKRALQKQENDVLER